MKSTFLFSARVWIMVCLIAFLIPGPPMDQGMSSFKNDSGNEDKHSYFELFVCNPLVPALAETAVAPVTATNSSGFILKKPFNNFISFIRYSDQWMGTVFLCYGKDRCRLLLSLEEPDIAFPFSCFW